MAGTGTTGPFTMWDKLVALRFEPEAKEEAFAMWHTARKVLHEPGATMGDEALRMLAAD
jgi:hypothetical protein